MTHRRISIFGSALSVVLSAAVLAWPSVAYAADRTPPTVPQDLRVTAATTDSVSVAWTPSVDGSGSVAYRIYVDGGLRATISTSAYTLTGLAGGDRYTVAVRASDRYGNVSRSSDAVTVSAVGRTNGPQPATDLRVTATGYDAVSLGWGASPSAVAYYQILRDGVWVNSSYSTTASVSYLQAGSTYTFSVRARDADGNFSAPVAVTVTTVSDAGPPTKPARLRVVPNANGTPAGLAWDTSTDDRAVGDYWLFADGDLVFRGGPGADFFTLTEVDCTLFHGLTHTFTVRARDVTGNLSEPSGPLTVTVP
jgi:chitinase